MAENKVLDEKLLKKELRGSVRAILRSLGDASLDWTIQLSLSSVEPDKVKYCCMVHIPTEGVAPITWVCDSYKELAGALKEAERELRPEMVKVAWHQSELQKIERMKQYHEEAIRELADSTDSGDGDTKS